MMNFYSSPPLYLSSGPFSKARAAARRGRVASGPSSQQDSEACLSHLAAVLPVCTKSASATCLNSRESRGRSGLHIPACLPRLGRTPGLHNKIPALKIFARGWVAQEPICYTINAKIFQGLGPKRRESCNGDRVYIHRNPTVGFHNFNLRIFNWRVSNPIK